MKRSRNVRTSVVLAASLAFAANGLAGCAEAPEQEADYSEVCVNQNYERVTEDNCEDEARRSGGGFLWMFFPRSYSVPPYGGAVSSSHGTTVKPTGTVGRVPAKGGFGSFRAGSGGTGG